MVQGSGPPPVGILASPTEAHLAERGRKVPHEVSLRVISGDDFAALAAAAPAWQQLADSAAEPNVFLEPWTLLPALRLYGSAQVQIAIIEKPSANGSRIPIGILPMVPARFHGLPIRSMRTWMHIHCYLGTPLIALGHCADVFAAIWQWLAAQTSAPSLLDLPTLVPDGAVFQGLVRFQHHRNMVVYPSEFYTRALLRRADTTGAYMHENIPGEERRLLRRMLRRLTTAGRLEVRAIGQEDRIDPWLEQFLTLEASGWKGRLGTAMNCSPADREYFLTISREAFARDRLLLVVITLNGQLVAAQHGIYAGEGAFAMKTAYDETYRRCSPGMLVEAEVIRILHEQQRCRWIDSCCSPGNTAMERIWRQHRTMTSFTCPVNRQGELLVSLLPLLRYGRRILRRMRNRKPA